MRWKAEEYDSVGGPQRDAGGDLIQMAGVGLREVVLELGCGTGACTVALAALCPEGSVVGTDLSEEMLALARAKAAALRNVSFHLTPAEEITFEDRFSLVFSNSALHWVKRQPEALARAHRALMRGGRIAFQFPSRDFFPELIDYTRMAIERLRLERYFEGWRRPWYQPSVEEYESLLAAAGFRDMDVRERDYQLVFDGVGGIVDWLMPTGLRPFLDRIPESERGRFAYAFEMEFEGNRTERGIEITLRRLFASGRK